MGSLRKGTETDSRANDLNREVKDTDRLHYQISYHLIPLEKPRVNLGG